MCYFIDDRTKTNIFSFHLQNYAKMWANSLSNDIQNDWSMLKSISFIKRFTDDKNAIDLSILQMTQNLNETILEYLSKLQKTASLKNEEMM